MVEKVLIFLLQIKVAVPQCRNTLAQVNVTMKKVFAQNVPKYSEVPKVKIVFIQHSRFHINEYYIILLDYNLLMHYHFTVAVGSD